MTQTLRTRNVDILGANLPGYNNILTSSALEFVASIEKELEQIENDLGKEDFAAGRHELASTLFEELVTTDEFAEFLTLSAYEHL